MADDSTVALAKGGDPEAWRALYREHAGRLVAWLRTRPTGDVAASAEDVAAEAWVVAASKIVDFTGSSSDFAGWLFGIARKLSATSKRTADRRRTQPGDAETHLEDTADDSVLVDDADWVRTTLSALPPRERTAVGLVDGLGIDVRTAAEIAGVSAVALRVARHRGLRRLGRTMGPQPVDTAGDVTTEDVRGR